MINISDRRAQIRQQQAMVRQMVIIERLMIPRLAQIIGRQYNAVASLVNQDVEFNTRSIVFSFNDNIILFFQDLYRRTSNIFLDLAVEDIEQIKEMVQGMEVKGMEEDFWREMSAWIGANALRKSTQINTTTAKLIRRIISLGVTNGESNAVISKTIKEKGLVHKRWRSDMIVRTETHSAAMKATDTAMRASRLVQVKQWINAGDKRVRQGKFNHRIDEIVDINDTFKETGEPMRYPGDPAGSAGNVIRCRCVAEYFTRDEAPAIR